jgi:hypothetical protein
MYYFCTYFDSNYLIKGLALYRSLVRHATPFRLWVLCFDDLAYETLRKLELPEVDAITMRKFEHGDEELLHAKRSRSRIEYYFTCTPSLPLYILINQPEVDVITYLDADLFFFSDPAPIYEELGNNSILIIEHRFPIDTKDRERYGIYNVGFLSFRRTKEGLQCLEWWRKRCIEWCYDRVENGRFADQKYLDDWPARLEGVVVVQHKGAGLAPWNVANYSLRLKKGQVIVDSYPLLFFHFHGVQRMARWLYDPNLERYGVYGDYLLRRHVYGPYIRELEEVDRWIRLSLPGDKNRIQMTSIRRGDRRTTVNGNPWRAAASKMKHHLLVIRRLLQGHIWIVLPGRI